jgi:uncharacterized OB-fold protein
MKPMPDVSDPDMRPFWEATRERRLTAQHCSTCGALRFPALEICDVCLSEGADWVDITAEGTIWSYVVYHRAFHPGFEGHIPYAVAIVETPEGVRYTGMIVGGFDGAEVGARVRAVFEDVTPQFTMVAWALPGVELPDRYHEAASRPAAAPGA